jgi:hypothetical protein
MSHAAQTVVVILLCPGVILCAVALLHSEDKASSVLIQ